MGSAYALWTDSVTVQVTAQSATMNVQIVDRTEDITAAAGSVVTELGSPTPATIDAANPTESVSESITNFIPGDTVTLEYKIVNDGSIDVLLSGINIAFSGTQTLQSLAYLTWTMTEYVGGVPGDTISGADHLDAITTSVDTSGDGLEILAGTADYCILTLELYIDDASGVPYTTVKETTFTITPVFQQN